MGEDRPGRRIVYTGDTAPVQSVEVYAADADVLVHEATFCEDEHARARETGHSTARQAAQTALEANVKLLALTHLSTRYFPREIRDEARAVFENTVVPRDFDCDRDPVPRARRAAPGQGASWWRRPRRRRRARTRPGRGRRARGLEPARQAGERRRGARLALRRRVAVVLWAPAALVDGVIEGGVSLAGSASWPAPRCCTSATSSRCSSAYAIGDLSVVYPLARGTRPGPQRRGAAILFLGERPARSGWRVRC